ncbi:MAG: sigma factor, partial [Candidatus Competibacterales bacterium]|nr:sigma factor [Candidatus Competibacterales bacterium]
MSSLAIADTLLSYAQARHARRAPSREQRFDQLVGVHMRDLYRYGYWLTGDKSVAEDLVQETMLRAWKSLDSLQDARAAKGWLLTILRRENARRFERYRPPESAMPVDELGDKHRGQRNGWRPEQQTQRYARQAQEGSHDGDSGQEAEPTKHL